ncbi:MAG: hypothetical protein LBJ00_09045 [Planctomycetaceae bacterium]|jgi:hypothetical protein|nr:hypothetical protein [Planctomycetaceae bacterium]
MNIFRKRIIVTLIFPAVLIFWAIVILPNFSIAQDKTEAKKPEPTIQKIAGLNAKFIVALIDDGEGGAWIGTEDEGVFHCNADGKVAQFTTKSGLGDNNGYALAIDKLGRLWVGHLNTGVSVFNGKDWKNYDVVDGPVGERIFDIKICPKDGAVWMATSAGISRYKIDADDWEHFTREDGLLEDQASTLAFKNDGTLIVGTQCHGLVIFNRNIKGDYKHAKNVVAPDRFGQNNCSPVPLTPVGSGLPSNLINDIIVTKNDAEQTIWIATNAGLVKVNESLTKLEYWRGKDYANKVRGLYGGAPKGWKEAPKEIMSQLLPEDHLTCLAEDEQGVIWIGTRQNGTVVADQQSGKKSYGTPKAMGYPDNFVTKILCLNGGDYLVGFYGGGIVKSIKPYKLVDRKPLKTRFNKDKIFSVAQNNFPKLPSKIKPPTAEELRTMYYEFQKIRRPSKQPNVLTLNDDWRTQGDWIDRYGLHSAVLCAQAGGGLDFFSGYRAVEMKMAAWIGRNYKNKDDVIRRWVHWIESDDKRVMQCENLGGRKQAEWDDHKEAYPMSLDGPHVYGTFSVPPGKYVVSLYFFNKDGHEGHNRLRDYVVTVKTGSIPRETLVRLGSKNVNAEKEFLAAPNGEKLRVRDFWGGVYKRFYVEVKQKELVTIQVNASYSFNTIVSSVMFDPAEPISLEKFFDPPPPARKPTAWESELTEINEEFWWGIKTMDHLFCLRDSNAVQFFPTARRTLLPLIRTFVRLDANSPKAPQGLCGSDKKRIRSDVGEMLREIQMFNLQDKINFGKLKYGQYNWQERTRLGREHFQEFENKDSNYGPFFEENRSKQTW